MKPDSDSDPFTVDHIGGITNQLGIRNDETCQLLHKTVKRTSSIDQFIRAALEMLSMI